MESVDLKSKNQGHYLLSKFKHEIMYTAILKLFNHSTCEEWLLVCFLSAATNRGTQSWGHKQGYMYLPLRKYKKNLLVLYAKRVQ